jgi:hypothetical protein
MDGPKQWVSSVVDNTRVLAVVEYSGHPIYKSTLVSQLNGNPFLSKDQLIGSNILSILIIAMITLLLLFCPTLVCLGAFAHYGAQLLESALCTKKH